MHALERVSPASGAIRFEFKPPILNGSGEEKLHPGGMDLMLPEMTRPGPLGLKLALHGASRLKERQA
jgi:hypothetical protein